MSAIIEVENLSRSLPGMPPVTLVTDVTLSIQPATFVAIVGPSGCGKSSLLYLLGLLDRPTSGQVLFNGQDMNPLRGDARAQIRLASFGFVFQFHFLLPEFTALENVMLPMRRLGKFTLGEIQARAQVLLEGMGLGEKSAKTPDRLSGGERQRVAIARAIANDPVLVLGDEPTGNLDSQNSARVIEMFRKLAHDQGRAVICVTHDPDVAAAADVQISMLDGRINETNVRPR
ncbi:MULTISPECIES: ABC transporter ATP-binding protein [Sphingobium]|uniref:ABC transporter ATP-binding protein n=1 Tax=Sphingobium sp. MI1205 TaxID=407020 RepID=UPI00077025CF|nr:ABC transporter ATP-binding protein [Sphingobium sp. MI1205]AMK17379.1 ABC-type transport system ATPase component [Sphingobium sp. MI1205]